MKIIDDIQDWWDRLEGAERMQLKFATYGSLIAMPIIFLATFFLFPYFYPAIAGLALGVAIACTLAYPLCAFGKVLLPIFDHFDSEPKVSPVRDTAPASGLVSEVTVAPKQEQSSGATHTQEHTETSERSP